MIISPSEINRGLNDLKIHHPGLLTFLLTQFLFFIPTYTISILKTQVDPEVLLTHIRGKTLLSWATGCNQCLLGVYYQKGLSQFTVGGLFFLCKVKFQY